MKNLLKKLNIMPNQSEEIEGSNSSKTNNKLNAGLSPRSQAQAHNKTFTALAGWFNSVTNRKSPSPPSSSNVRTQDIMDQHLDSASSSGLDVNLDVGRRDSESSNSKDPDVEEEYQIQLAMEMSAREDPEAVQIEAVKQISLGSHTQENTPAEVVAFRYWVSF